MEEWSQDANTGLTGRRRSDWTAFSWDGRQPARARAGTCCTPLLLAWPLKHRSIRSAAAAGVFTRGWHSDYRRATSRRGRAAMLAVFTLGHVGFAGEAARVWGACASVRARAHV